jgi:hypothetical protein
MSLNAFSQSRSDTFTFDASRNSHKATITLTVTRFNPKEHEISGLQPCDDLQAVKIDGRTPIGAGICNTPKYEIISMALVFDGHKIRIPKEIYADCYEPPFAWSMSHISDYFSLRIGDDLKSVFVFMSGSDGAGHYDVIWVFRSDGKHSRITNTASDCGMINFDCPTDQP